MKSHIHSQTSTVQPLKFGNGYIISSHTLFGLRLLIHAGNKVNPCWWKRPLVAISLLIEEMACLHFSTLPPPIQTCRKLYTKGHRSRKFSSNLMHLFQGQQILERKPVKFWICCCWPNEVYNGLMNDNVFSLNEHCYQRLLCNNSMTFVGHWYNHNIILC